MIGSTKYAPFTATNSSNYFAKCPSTKSSQVRLLERSTDVTTSSQPIQTSTSTPQSQKYAPSKKLREGSRQLASFLAIPLRYKRQYLKRATLTSLRWTPAVNVMIKSRAALPNREFQIQNLKANSPTVLPCISCVAPFRLSQ